MIEREAGKFPEPGALGESRFDLSSPFITLKYSDIFNNLPRDGS
jgi:hypothetical protein